MNTLPKPSSDSIIYEDDLLYCCLAIYPLTNGHSVVVWKKPVKDLHLLSRLEYEYLMEKVDLIRNALMKGGERGTVENEMVPAGVPAITLEIGHPEIFDAAMNARTIDGILRVMEDMDMLAGGTAPRATVTPFVGNKQEEVRSPRGGWARLLVALNQDVVAGQPVATLSDAFGRTIATLTAPVGGRVSSVATDPRRDEGSMLLRIAYWSDDPACAAGC